MSAEIQHAQHKSPSQLDAWDRIMRAHWHVRRFTENDLAEARRLLGEAIALDPTNSMAYSDLAFARHFEAVFGWGEGPAQSHAAFAEEARKAVILDDGDAPPPIPRWRSTRCSRAAKVRPGVGYSVPSILTPTSRLPVGSSATPMPSAAIATRQCRISMKRSD
jgi:hypothetical protein